MSNERFQYRGPATIDGVDFPNVTLAEQAPEGGLRSWEGTTSFSAAAAPAGFSANVATSGAVTVLLPDGREGLAFVNASFDGHAWTLDLTGTGPAPS